MTHLGKNPGIPAARYPCPVWPWRSLSCFDSALVMFVSHGSDVRSSRCCRGESSRRGLWVLLWTAQEYKGSLPASFLGFGVLFFLLSLHLLDIIEATGFQPFPDHHRLFEVYLINNRYLYSPSTISYSSQ
jgi:hypothetical protein